MKLSRSSKQKLTAQESIDHGRHRADRKIAAVWKDVIQYLSGASVVAIDISEISGHQDHASSLTALSSFVVRWVLVVLFEGSLNQLRKVL